MNKESAVIFKAENISKSFGVTKALDCVNIELKKGQLLGLIGENGSGKSTLASIIAAIQPADDGELIFNGEPYAPKDSVQASQLGVSMILQEKGTFDKLTVAKNIFVGKEKRFIKFGKLSNQKLIAEAEKALKAVGANHIKPDELVGNISFEDRKLVELVRAMYDSPKILIVDETTTALSRTGRELLYSLINKMKNQGDSVIFISHDIDELMDVCDKLTILRDGIYIDSLEKTEFNASKIKQLMVGREICEHYYRNDMEIPQSNEIVLKVENVCEGLLKDISFELKKGEILGIGGLTDCGMHELGKIAFGLNEPSKGTVTVNGGKEICSAEAAVKEKIAYISKDRDHEALMVSSGILDNVCIASYPKLKDFGLILPKHEKQFLGTWKEKLNIKMRSENQYVMELSGGNKQKVALAKWLGFGADIYILDCPTRGIDIGVKATIYDLMMRLREQGKSILLISEELSEVIGMSDRIIILKEGEIQAEFNRQEELTENKLIEYIV